MFYFQKGYNGREINSLLMEAEERREPWKFGNNAKDTPDGWIPIGSVEWVEQKIGVRKPDYYPEFARGFLGRTIIGPSFPLKQVFIKPARRHKEFEGQVWNLYQAISSDIPEFYLSDYVEFTNEWRYYIADGKVLCAWWYKGEEDKIAPPLPADLKIPQFFCGAMDWGETKDGRFILVENNLPYSIGWYGDNRDKAKYYEFIKCGWRFLNI